MTDLPKLGNKAAVVGVGTTAFGSFPERDEYSLAAEAFSRALADCGLTRDDIDGFTTCRIPNHFRMGEVLGLAPRWMLQLPAGGRFSAVGLVEAVAAIATGQANHIAMLYANIGRSRRMNYGGDETPDIWDAWRFTSPGASFALMFRRHMELYGTTTRQLAEVSVAIRAHATLNPDAVMRRPITIEDHETSRPIVAPLRLLDYCLINDGATCLILSSAERARDCAKRPVLISGTGAQELYAGASLPLFNENFFHSSIRAAGEQSYAMAGVSRRDVDALMCYDNFSPAVLFALEGLGFCGEGEGGAFVEGGTIGPGGALPMNTDGGHLSNSYMQGWALNIEAVRQVRGECGARQVKDCEVAQYVQGTPSSRSILYTRG